MGTILVAGILLLAVSGIICRLLKDKKQGKTTCGGNCAHCSGCHH